MKINKAIVIVVLCAFLACDEGANKILIRVKIDEENKVCLLDPFTLHLTSCEKVDTAHIDSLLNGQVYEKYNEKYKEVLKSYDDEEEDVHAKITSSCDDRFVVFPNGHRLFSMRKKYQVPYSYAENTYYEYIYRVYHQGTAWENEQAADILCGIRNGKCEVVYSGPFYQYASRSSGKYILFIQIMRKGLYHYYSLEPETKQMSLVIASDSVYPICYLNKTQSIMCINDTELHVYDHNKNKIKKICNIPKEYRLWGATVIASTANMFIVFDVTEREFKHGQNSLIILDFSKDKVNHEMKILNIPGCTSIRAKTITDPFVFDL